MKFKLRIRELIALFLYYIGRKPMSSTFIDEDTITMGYGTLHEIGAWQYDLPPRIVLKFYGTTSRREYCGDESMMTTPSKATREALDYLEGVHYTRTSRGNYLIDRHFAKKAVMKVNKENRELLQALTNLISEIDKRISARAGITPVFIDQARKLLKSMKENS